LDQTFSKKPPPKLISLPDFIAQMPCIY